MSEGGLMLFLRDDNGAVREFGPIPEQVKAAVAAVGDAELGDALPGEVSGRLHEVLGAVLSRRFAEWPGVSADDFGTLPAAALEEMGVLPEPVLCGELEEHAQAMTEAICGELLAAGLEVLRREYAQWPELAELTAKLEEKGAVRSVLALPGRASRLARAMTFAAVWRLNEDKRRKAMPTPTIHPVAVAGLAALRPRVTFRGAASALAISGRDRGGDDIAGLIMPSAVELGDDSTAGRAYALAGVICRRVHEQCFRGEQDYARVALTASGLQSAGVVQKDLRGDERDAAVVELLEALASVRVKGLGALIDADSIDLTWEVLGPSGGRPSRVIVVRAGDALCPFGVLDWYRRERIVPPDGLRFWGPVFEPAWTPLCGTYLTRPVQAAAYTVGLGQWLMSRRQEYAERGGVKLDTLDKVLRGLGMYVRTHSSLVDRVKDEWRTTPLQPVLGGPTSAVLVETSPGSGLWKLGDGHPEYRAAHRMLMEAVEVASRKKRKAAMRKAR